MKKTILISIMIDGLRYDYLDRAKPKYLLHFMQNGLRKRVKEPLTFQTRPTFFAGLYPANSDIANLFYFDPPNSPFKFLRILPLSLLDKVTKKLYFIDFLLRMIITKIGRIFEFVKGNKASANYLDTVSIPFSFLPYFAPTEKKLIYEKHSLPKESIFDLMRKKGLNFELIAYPIHKQTNRGINKYFNHLKDKHNTDFLFIHFSELDWIGHKFGPESPKIIKNLREIDNVIGNILNYYCQNSIDIKLIVFGDHGMVSVEKEVDIISYLNDNGYKSSKLDCYFLDSNMFRFWTKNKDKVKLLENILRNADFGVIIDEKLAEYYHYNFKHRKYGDFIFLANPGIVFYPNFFQKCSGVKGMHGYGPNVNDNDTEVVIYLENIKDSYKLTEIEVDLTSLYNIHLKLLEFDNKDIKNLGDGIDILQKK